jgi:hypothetical protein
VHSLLHFSQKYAVVNAMCSRKYCVVVLLSAACLGKEFSSLLKNIVGDIKVHCMCCQG